MIVELDSSLIEALKDGSENTSELISFFSDVFTSISRGSNLFRARKPDLMYLASTELLSENQRNIARIEAHQATYRQALDEDYEFKLFLYHSDFYGNSLPLDVISVDIKNYNSLKSNYNVFFLDTPIVVFEDLRDDKVFNRIAKWFMSREQSYRGYTLNYEAVPGGGANTHYVCESLIDRNRMVFSVVDSDRKYPGDKLGETAKNTFEVFKKRAKEKHLLVLNVHEVENLLPHSLLKDTARQEQEPVIEFLQHVNAECDSSSRYFDIKKSFKFSIIFQNIETALSRYWKPLIESWDDSYEARFRECVAAGRKEYTHAVLNGLSSMLPTAIESFSNEPDERLAPNNGMYDDWEEIGKFLFSCGACSKPITI